MKNVIHRFCLLVMTGLIVGSSTAIAQKLVFHVFGALAEFERELIREQKPGSPLLENEEELAGDQRN